VCPVKKGQRDGGQSFNKVTGWDIDRPKQEEHNENHEKAEKQWKVLSAKRSVLDKESCGEELQKEAEWIQ